MIRADILYLCIVVMLTSCAVKDVPVEVYGDTYHDKNIPAIEVTFPFDVKIEDKRVDHADGGNIITCLLSTGKQGRVVVVQKQKIYRMNYGFRGSDDSVEKDPFYLDKHKNGFCVVNTMDHDGDTYLSGKSYRYISNKSISIVEMHELIGPYVLKRSIHSNHTGQLNSFIENMKVICEQNR